MSGYVLGLDLGSNSIGWAAVRKDDEDDQPAVQAGVRIFPEGVQQPNTMREKPRGQQRREARSARRVHQRRNHRRHALREALTEVGLMPGDQKDLDAVFRMEPYALRAKALDHRLDPHEMGRVLYHLCQRRGFKSNRKSSGDGKEGEVKKATAQLADAMSEAGSRTLGEYLARFVRADGTSRDHARTDLPRIRYRYTLRSMYSEEFDAIWEAQQPHHPDVLTDELRSRVHHIIFYQRPLKYRKEVIGDCELEPGEKRCSRGHWLAQQFRLQQEVNLLKLVEADTGEERPLTEEERTTLVEALTPKSKMTFDQIRKILDLHDADTFNLETAAGRKNLSGNPIERALRAKPLGKWYETIDDQTRDQLYDALAEVEDPAELERLGREEWDLDEKQVTKLLAISVPTGRFRLSLKAIRKVMPFLEAGHIYSEAKEKAGYDIVRKVEVHDNLLPVDQVVPNLTNPLVHRALAETRKVVNRLIREHGIPDEIVIELAREMKSSRDRRRKRHFENLDRRRENDDIRSRLISEFDIPNPSRADVIKYRLWQECERVCPYTGRTISAAKLFSNEIDVEHILPYDRTLDDSYMNKTLCFADENRRKGKQTPWEAYGTDEERFEEIIQRVRNLPYPKRKRFAQKEVKLEGFVERQLRDTCYISRQSVAYLRTLGCTVRCVKGATTAVLRHEWGLNGLLDDGPVEGKTRDDHRHHAVDAAVVALTTRSALQRLSSARFDRQTEMPPPWPSLRQDMIEALGEIRVSHRHDRRLGGAMHKEMIYGPVDRRGEGVRRAPLRKLSWNRVSDIRDDAIRAIVQKAVKEACQAEGIELKPSDPLSKALGDQVVCMPSGVPIKKVRFLTRDSSLRPLDDSDGSPATKLVLPGSNHHLAVYEKDAGAWTGRIVSRFEAYRRRREGLPIVSREPLDGMGFVMSLCLRDMLLMQDPDTGRDELWVVKAFSVGKTPRFQPDIQIIRHTTAHPGKHGDLRITNWETKFRKLNPRKVSVDPIGRISACND